MEKLSRLRLFFIVYFIVKVIIDFASGSHIVGMTTSYFSISANMFYTLAVMGNLILFSAGLMLFHFLLEKRNWARIVLLAIGWLAVFNFMTSLLFSSKAREFLMHIDLNINWDTLMLIDRATDLAGYIFWGYAIFILLFDPEVKKIFQLESMDKDREQQSAQFTLFGVDSLLKVKCKMKKLAILLCLFAGAAINLIAQSDNDELPSWPQGCSSFCLGNEDYDIFELNNDHTCQVTVTYHSCCYLKFRNPLPEIKIFQNI